MAAHAVGAVVSHVLDADTIDEANAHVNDDSRDDHSQYIKTDGTRAFTALTAVGGTPVAVGTTIAVGTANTLARSDHVHSLAANAVVTASIANLAVTKAKIETEQQFPAGVIMDYGGAAAPSGWVLCDGTSYATSAHPDLFGAIGYVYGGSGLNFSVPDFTGRVAAMKSASGTFSVLGETGGVSAVTLVTANLPSHTHTINHDHAAQNTGAGTSHTHTIDAGGGDLVYTATSTLGLVNTGIAQTVSYNDANVTNSAESAHTHPVDIAAFTGSSSATGSATAVNALPPYLVINKIIKL
jgi:microcystin-dependent protein